MYKKQILNKYFHFNSFRYNQEEAIDSILDKKNTLCILSTGGGKSLIYQICGLMFKGITIVISPLVSLMEDQVKNLSKKNISAKFIASSLEFIEKKKIYDDLIKENIKFLYVSPEKLEDLNFINLIKDIEVSQVVIDEAHCISLYGHDFRPSFRNVLKFISIFKIKPVISLFTATASKYVINDLSNMFNDLNIIKSDLDRKNLYYKNIKTNNKFYELLKYLNVNDSIIIYCLTIKICRLLFDELNKLNYKVCIYHSKIDYIERKHNNELFMNDKANIMIATNSYGMGIDKSDIRYVINYGIPMSLEDLIQQQGRCARDGKNGKCILIYNRFDIYTNKYFISKLNFMLNKTELKTVKKIKEEKLKDIFDYLNTKLCLRKYLLNYFSQKSKSICGNCANCKIIKKRNYIKIVQMIIDTIKITKGIYSSEIIVDILVGKNSSKIKKDKLNRIITFNKSIYDRKVLNEIINNLLIDNFINKSEKNLILNNNSLIIYKKEKYFLAI